MGDLVEMGGARKPEEEQEQQQPTQPEGGIRAFDQEGREVIVPREEWRTNVLPNMLRELWDNPEQSYLLILNSLNDGFVDEVAEAAEHLSLTDPIPARGACIWGIVLIQQGKLDEAQIALEVYTEKHGDDGSVLTNLAKVYAGKGETAKAEETLWRALEIEPNLDNGLGWYVAQEQEKGGEPAARAALERVAALPGSWRALLWLARPALAAGDLPAAIELYREALSRANKMVQELGLPAIPGDFLMQMSGDLGGAGYLAELVELTGPAFVPEMHGLPVGNNLIKANYDLQNYAAAAQIVAALDGFQRPEWRDALNFWRQELAKVQGGALGAPVSGEVQIGMLRIDGPIWLPMGSPAWSLFGGEQARGEVSVTFLGGTAETPKAGPEGIDVRLADIMGRMTRSLPLFLAEQVAMRTAVQGRAMLPWATGPQSGFVISSSAWSDEQTAAAVGGQTGAPGVDPTASTYAVSVHLDATVEPWTAELAFIRVADGVRIGEMFAEFPASAPEDGLPGLADEVVELLDAVAPGAAVVSPRYEVPADQAFSGYLLRLEQLLAVRCASMDATGQGAPANFLNGERDILDGELKMCNDLPMNVPARLLLVETMSALMRVKPEVVEEYRERVEKLMEEQPLAV
ncbi:Tetratricopeptide repeat-containing protein [Granulicella rosea]|uniref:Tetratricopeptide repeat-containing protein n=1 Tax=Granulicella rosea TaxID=474952 RepID=A0A239CV64_9BACT|nr:tetratricopeptide repeat protein [Granulicella rosea]SNS23551.1 Tetratricopeptide repeat-containing protein [Granulicella rosea]